MHYSMFPVENGECSICSLFTGWQKNLNALPSMGCNDFKCILIPLYYFNLNEIYICHLKAQPTCIFLQGLTKVLRFIAIYVRQLLEIHFKNFKQLKSQQRYLETCCVLRMVYIAFIIQLQASQKHFDTLQ